MITLRGKFCKEGKYYDTSFVRRKEVKVIKLTLRSKRIRNTPEAVNNHRSLDHNLENIKE